MGFRLRVSQIKGSFQGGYRGYLGVYRVWGFPKLGVPITRIIAFGGLYWGPPICGNLQGPNIFVQGSSGYRCSEKPPYRCEYLNTEILEGLLWILITQIFQVVLF